MLAAFLIIFALTLLAYWIYKIGYKNEGYFDNHPIPSLKPTFLVGNTGSIMQRKQFQADFVADIYKKYPNEPILGLFDMRNPLYLIRDAELVKRVAIKDFDQFVDHRSFFDGENDPIFGKNLVSLKGEDWREMRTNLSPAFTGSKMRAMFELVSVCGNELTKYIDRELKTKSHLDLEIKEFFTKFTNDVIATCAFGIEVNSQNNPENEFYKMGARVMNFGGLVNRLKFLCFLSAPYIAKLLNLKFMGSKDEKFFRSTILDTMKTRERENIVRPDLINILLNLKKGQLTKASDTKTQSEFSVVDEFDLGKVKTKHEWSDDELLAQCLIFFLAGFDTVSTGMTFVAYELALNPDIQSKVHGEIDEVNQNLDGGLLTYDTLQKMKYLDMVVSETLRKWPPAPVTDRVCTASTVLEVDGKKVPIKKGDYLWIPMYSIQHDEKYYPNPEKFDPERFSDERKHEINPNTYLPFGIGPRNCIGSRFALMELKAAMFYVLKNAKFEVYEKTAIPIIFGAKKFRMIPDDGLFIRISPRA